MILPDQKHALALYRIASALRSKPRILQAGFYLVEFTMFIYCLLNKDENDSAGPKTRSRSISYRFSDTMHEGASCASTIINAP